MNSGLIMKTHIKQLWKFLAIPFAAGMLVILQACGNSNAESADKQVSNDDIINVSVEPVKKAEFVETLKLAGSVESFEDVQLSSEEGGKLLKWVVPKGAHVTAGSIIARLDTAIFKAGYDAANAQYKLAEVAYQKQKKVYEQQAISELQLKTLEYQRDAAKAQSDLARARFERTIIRSPLSGMLNNRFFEEGELVPPGVPLAHIVNTDRVKINAGVPERYAGRLSVGDPVTFAIDAFPGETYTGKITFIASSVSRDNRTIPIEASVSGAGGKMKPDMIATLNITLRAIPNAIVIPSDYIQQVDMNKRVVYVEDGGLAHERQIEIGSMSQGKAHITKGLREGEKLITLGFQNVADGQKVNVK